VYPIYIARKILYFPAPNKIRARQAAAITNVYSKPPLAKKNPLSKCTLTAAVRIKIKSRAAEILVNTPRIKNTPPIKTV
jgi:hypothetical protein